MKINLPVAYLCTAAIALWAVACSKPEDEVVPEAETRLYHLSEVIHIAASGTDTTRLMYRDNEILQTTTYSNSNNVSVTRSVKGNGFYNVASTVNGQPSLTTYIRINVNGSVDSVHSTRADKTVNSISNYYYDGQGYGTRTISNYVTYENDYTYHYENGNYKYWINNFRNFTTPAQNRQDSIVFEFTNFADKVPYKVNMIYSYGKTSKNLVKQRNYYNRLNGTLYQTWEYQYKLNEEGLVAEEIWNVYEQPAVKLIRTDTSRMKYGY